MDENPHYGRAPVLEAIIELRFDGEPLPERETQRVLARFKADYPSQEERKDISVEIGNDGTVVTKSETSGYKLTAKNAVDVVLVTKHTFGSTRLAPYDRWETFQAKSKENFEEFTKIVGRKKISRIGVRYLNRFDIPRSELEGQPFAKFLNVTVGVPAKTMKAVGEFNVRVSGIENTTGARLSLNCGSAPPALLSHVSFGLDIDVFWDADKISGRVDEMWASTDVLRRAKNMVFENSITDALRALIR